MAKPFWKGTISFGMVAIPVKMSLATESTTPGFHLLHGKCHTRPKQVLYCQKDDEYFSQKDTVRGYEYARGQHLVFTEEDFEKVPVKTAHTVDIQKFVDLKDVDPVYFYNSHYLMPEELGTKPYYLLMETLAKTKRVGIAKVAFQQREHLCVLRPMDGILVLHSIHFADEILPHEEITPAKPEISAAESEMAEKLVDTMAGEFKSEQYRDEYSLALQKLIKARLEGLEVEAPPEVKEEEFADLMTALKASIGRAEKASKK